jgi:ankyrin repeat protein
LDINAADRHGNTATVWAAMMWNATNRAAQLKAAKCDVTIRNENRDTVWALANQRAKRFQLRPGTRPAPSRTFDLASGRKEMLVES